MDTGSYMQILLSLVGQQQGQQLTQQALDVYKKQIADMAGIPLPNLPNITPEQLGQAQAGQVQADPQLQQTESDVLANLGDVYSKGGLDFRTKADLNDAMSQADSQAQSAQDSIKQHLQGTGQLGSGADIAMQMGASQGASQRGGDNAFKTAALGEQRKMDALTNQGSLASSMRGQDFAEREQTAQANDARAEWNAQSRQGAQQYNAGLPQQQFQNQVSKVTGGFAPGSNLATAYGNQASDQRSLWGNLGAAANYGWKANKPGSGGNGSGYTSDPNNLYTNANNPYPSDPSPTGGGGSSPDEWNWGDGGYYG